MYIARQQSLKVRRGGEIHHITVIGMEPLGGIEPPTFALPRRRYTPKPQWQRGRHLRQRFNAYGGAVRSTPQRRER